MSLIGSKFKQTFTIALAVVVLFGFVHPVTADTHNESEFNGHHAVEMLSCYGCAPHDSSSMNCVEHCLKSGVALMHVSTSASQILELDVVEGDSVAENFVCFDKHSCLDFFVDTGQKEILLSIQKRE